MICSKNKNYTQQKGMEAMQFYEDLVMQKTAEQRMEEITLKNVLEQYHIRLEGIQRDGDCGCPGDFPQSTGYEASSE